MASQMKPEHIIVSGPTPLTACFGKAEAEQAAVLLLLGMQAAGTWDSVSLQQIKAHLRVLCDSNTAGGGNFARWLKNPFFQPDIDLLITGGFAEWVGNETEGRKRPVRFTATGLAALRLSRWNTCTVSVCSACLRASCWQGKHFCESYRAAGVVEKTPFQLKALQASGESVGAEDPSYWDVCDSCGTACGGKCSV